MARLVALVRIDIVFKSRMIATLPPPRIPNGCYSRESDLVDRFVDALHGEGLPWGELEITQEWDYQTGITDVLARTSAGDLVAFEAKLADWRRAAHQAYRNTVFAQRAYVVLPKQVALKAARCSEVFSRYQIGLCAVDDACINVLIEAPRNDVLIPWLREKATNFFDHESRERQARARTASGDGDLSANRRVA